MGYARNPNGTGSFVIQAPTFNANNQGLGIDPFPFEKNLKFYPNPTSNTLNLVNDYSTIENVQIVNLQGQILFQNKYSNQNNVTLDFSNFPNGIYLVTINNQSNIKIIKN